MPTRDPRVDVYIGKAPAYAQPILTEARARFHAAIAGLGEDIKWRVPFYSLGGKVVGSMAAFKKHVKVGVWSSAPGTMGLPEFFDVSTVAELPPAKEFGRFVKTVAAANVAAQGAARKAAPAAKKAAKSATKKAPATKRAPAKKAPAKKAPAKKASRK
jgi:hypothetical protein